MATPRPFRQGVPDCVGGCNAGDSADSRLVFRRNSSMGNPRYVVRIACRPGRNRLNRDCSGGR